MSIKYGAREFVDLGGVWKYKVDETDQGLKADYYKTGFDRSNWKEMKVPNNWYLTEVGDYDGAVWFATTFEGPESFKGKEVTLKFRAVDYIADVWLNGEYLGLHEGYFAPFEFNVTDKIRIGSENELVVRNNSPRDPTEYILVDNPFYQNTPMSKPYKRHWAKALTTIKGHLVDAMHRPGAMTSFRQDGNTGGIWQTVELIAQGDVQIKNTKIYTQIVEKNFVLDGTAIVSVDVELNNSTNRIIETKLNMTIKPKNFKGDEVLERIRDVQLQPGHNSFKLVRTLQKPQLWWTWDHGFPHLYSAEISVGEKGEYDGIVETFGVKKIVHDEATGHWYLNDRRLFLRGMRYFSSQYMSEITEERLNADLGKMLDMKINSIRIGSHLELSTFYDLCDEMGFLVWQVFPLHYCYSDSDELIERAAFMMREMVCMLYNHASIGMWSVFKEPKVYALPNPPNNYGRLCHIMREAAHTVDPTRWVHLGDYDEGVQNLMLGCCRPGEQDLKKTHIEPNIVEFGCHSIPCLESLKKIIPEKDLWPPNWDTWEYWGFFYNLHFGYGKVDMGDSLEEFIDKTQNYEAHTIKEQIEFFRQRKYSPVGSMYLYYWSDPAPVIGSGLIDYFGKPYKAYDEMKKVYTPVLVSLEWNKDPYIIGYEKFWKPKETFMGKVWIINDHHEDLKDAVLSWRLVRKDDAKAVLDKEMTLSVGSDSSQVCDTIVWEIPEDAKGKHQVLMELKSGQGEVLSKNYFDLTVT